MPMFRTLLAALVALVAASFLVPSTAAAADYKFWASEFKVSQEMPEKSDDEQEYVIPTISLTIKGRASLGGGDKTDFVYEVKDARMWLDVLQICSGSSARLQGEVDSKRIEQDGNRVAGKGTLKSLTCRQILK